MTEENYEEELRALAREVGFNEREVSIIIKQSYKSIEFLNRYKRYLDTLLKADVDKTNKIRYALADLLSLLTQLLKLAEPEGREFLLEKMKELQEESLSIKRAMEETNNIMYQ